jgi:hypothetical protein
MSSVARLRSARRPGCVRHTRATNTPAPISCARTMPFNGGRRQDIIAAGLLARRHNWPGELEPGGFIGHGGMATVYKAYQEALGRYVAVKVLLSNRDLQFAACFKREARAIAALQHHNILPIYDYGEQNSLVEAPQL